MKKFSLSTLISYLLSASLFFACIFYALPSYRQKSERSGARCIRLWHVDTFEGGMGSRGQFLKKIAGEFEKKQGGIVLLTVHTVEGIEEELKKGNYPDLLSFGVGVFPPIEKCKTSLDGKVFTTWCKGGYALYAKTEDFTMVEGGNTVLSIGGKNLAEIPALFLGLEGAKREDSVSAYVHFLQGKYRYLLGTQRDYFRFLKRGERVYFSPLYCYCDLSQYICILSSEEVKHSQKFVEYLMKKSSQERLTEIGMFSEKYRGAEGELSPFQAQEIEYILPPYASEEGIQKLKEGIEKGNLDLLKKFLKQGEISL